MGFLKVVREFSHRGLTLCFLEDLGSGYPEINILPFTLEEFFVKWFCKDECSYLSMPEVEKLANMTNKELEKLIDEFLEGKNKKLVWWLNDYF